MCGWLSVRSSVDTRSGTLVPACTRECTPRTTTTTTYLPASNNFRERHRLFGEHPIQSTLIRHWANCRTVWDFNGGTHSWLVGWKDDVIHYFGVPTTHPCTTHHPSPTTPSSAPPSDCVGVDDGDLPMVMMMTTMMIRWDDHSHNHGHDGDGVLVCFSCFSGWCFFHFSFSIFSARQRLTARHKATECGGDGE